MFFKRIASQVSYLNVAYFGEKAGAVLADPQAGVREQSNAGQV
jgi:hypothetical protein